MTDWCRFFHLCPLTWRLDGRGEIGSAGRDMDRTTGRTKDRRLAWRTWVAASAFVMAAWLGAGAALAEAQPKVIYGQDNRRETFRLAGMRARNADSTVALVPVSAIRPQGNGTSELVAQKLATRFDVCPSERFRAQPTAAVCSGFLAGPDIVVTAGHCVSDYDLFDRRFVFGYRTDRNGRARTVIADSEIYRGVEVLASRIDSADFAVVRLDRKVVGHRPLPMQRSGSVSRGLPLYVIGHPSGLPAKYAAGATVTQLSTDFFSANLDTYGGNSGSPVFNARSHTVVGVLVRGAPDYVFRGDCQVSNILPNTPGAEEATLTSRIAPFVPRH